MKTFLILTMLSLISLALTGAASAEARPEFRKEQQAKRQEFKKQNREEKQAFRETLKGKSGEEKQTALLRKHQELLVKRRSFNEEMHTRRMEKLKAKLEKNSKLTPAQKTELLNYYDQQYKENRPHNGQCCASDGPRGRWVARHVHFARSRPTTESAMKSSVDSGT